MLYSRAVACTALPHQPGVQPVSGLISSRSAQAGRGGMAAPGSRSPPAPGLLPADLHPRPGGAQAALVGSCCAFPSASSLQIELPKASPLTRGLDGNTWALSLRSPLPLHSRESFPAPSAQRGRCPEAHPQLLSPTGRRAKAIVDPRLDPAAGAARAEGWVWRPDEPPAEAVCFHGAFTTVNSLKSHKPGRNMAKTP